MESLSMRLVPVFDWLLRTTLQAALLLCLILVVQLMLRRRLGVRWGYYLWLLLLIRLAVPWLPESKVSIFNWVPRSIQQGGIIESLSQRDQVGRHGFYSGMRFADTQETRPESDSRTLLAKFVRMLPLLWLLGMMLLAVYVGAGNFHLWWLVTRERPLTDQKILDLLEDCKAEMRIRNILGVVITDKVRSPALFGFIRPRLLLPAGMVEALSREELRYVFLHELGHLKRYDIYIGWLTSLLQVLHWFNPLVWFAFYRMQSDRELACDALVLSCARSHESKEYGRTIVSLLERFSRPQRLPSMAGILETKSQLKRRIKMIAQFKKTSRPRWAGAMLLLTVLACVVLTNAYVAKADFEFGEPVNLKTVIPVIDPAHDNINCFSYDGLEMYISGDRPGGYGDWDHWVSRRASKDDSWGPPENLGPLVNSPKHDSLASISADGLTLYFSSDRPGGYGNFDVWMTTRATKDIPWGQPVNLGPKINKPVVGDASPWISADDLELYFTSFRAGGYGSGDIYVVTRATPQDTWGEPMNLGPVVNSSCLEVCPSLSPDGLVLLFTDGAGPRRPGGYGSADMWMTKRASLSDPWQTPVNLGPKVNGPDADCPPRFSPDGRTIYFFAGVNENPTTWSNWQAPILPICDFNGDGIVDIEDVCIMVEHWHTDYPLCDIGPMPWGDGFVDAQDLTVLAEHLFEDSRPTAHWKLDEGGGSIAYDSAGRYDADLHGGPVWQTSGGKEGGALQLDGTNDYVSTPFILDPAKGSFSVFAWVKSNARGQVIISQNDATGTRWLWTDPSYGRLTTWLMHPPFDPLMSVSTITDGQWHHVGMVYDSIGLKRHLYMDGAEAAKDTDFVGGVSSNGGLYFGADKTLEPASFFSGLIDDVRIYDGALSAEEVAELAR